MNTTIRTYGLYSSITICVLFLLSWFLGKDLDFSTQEVLGYASMIVSLSFVYFGIKHFRDHENNGTVTFGKALFIGTLISLLAALAFGILYMLYIKYINPDFLTEYYEVAVAEMKESLASDEFEERLAEMESEKELFSNIWFNFLVMSLTVFIIGFIISLISSLMLQRKD